MKLVHPDFYCQLEFSENKILVLVLESPKDFTKFLNELRCQIEGEDGKWILSEDGNILKITKACSMIIDPFSIDVNQRKILTALYSSIASEVNTSELMLEWNSLCADIVRVLEAMAKTTDFSLSYHEEFDLKDFLKYCNFHFSVEEGSLLEKLLYYFETAKQVLGIKLFVLINIKSYLTKEEIGYLYEQAFYKKYYLLLVECNTSEEKSALEKTVIIDNEGCLIC